MKNLPRFAGVSMMVVAIAFVVTTFTLGDGRVLSAEGRVESGESLLTGAVTSAAGEKMGGVTVSAKAEGSTITTSVFTDDTGNYYFPPLPNGKHRVWAQALTYQRANGDVELKKETTRQDFVMQPMKNQEDWIRQLPGDEFLAALPGETPEDYRMKTQVRKNCTGCHSASYQLQHRFDEEGWNKILDLMKHVNVLGVYFGPDHKATPNIDFHQKELAAYLARARGPGESSMKFKDRPRATGEGWGDFIKTRSNLIEKCST